MLARQTCFADKQAFESEYALVCNVIFYEGDPTSAKLSDITIRNQSLSGIGIRARRIGGTMLPQSSSA